MLLQLSEHAIGSPKHSIDIVKWKDGHKRSDIRTNLQRQKGVRISTHNHRSKSPEPICFG